MKLYLDNTRTKPNIICIQESKLKSNSKFNLPGYNKEEKLRPDEHNPGGRVTTFIRMDMKYEKLNNIPNEIEGVNIKIKSTEGDITVTNLYLPRQTFDNVILKSIISEKIQIMRGDVNAANALWGASTENVRGKQLEGIIDELGLTVLNTGEGTFLKRDGTYSHLDVGIAGGNVALKCSWRRLDDEWGSDHRPTEIIVNENPICEENTETKLNHKKANCQIFRNACKEDINNEVISDTDCTYEVLAGKILLAAVKAMPRSRRKTTNRHKMVPFWNNNAKQQ